VCLGADAHTVLRHGAADPQLRAWRAHLLDRVDRQIALTGFFPADDATAAAMRDYPLT
jgi:hypothetical protein